MAGWLDGLFGRKPERRPARNLRPGPTPGPRAGASQPGQSGTSRAQSAQASPAKQVQLAYWTFKEAEKAALLSRYPAALSWPELLRLHHLTCLELMSQGQGASQLADPDADLGAPPGAAAALCREIAERLLSSASPYRRRHCAIWQGQPGQTELRQPDLQGKLANASVSHLGCLEVIRLDVGDQPKELVFVPLDDLRGAMFGGQSLFRAARLLYDDGRPDEVVLAPLIYGLSWRSSHDYDRDGSLTRFCCHMDVKEDDGTSSASIGVGHQDLKLLAKDGSQTLLGLGSVGEIMVVLEMTDPRFDQKCRSRGLDPGEIRRKMGQT